MITKEPKQSVGAFQDLYNEANAALPQVDGSINSVNSYFVNLEELIAKDTKFLVLPPIGDNSGENYFDINANTRKITVPTDFRNGAGVKGDQTAEIIYFAIDRYFDYKDLNTVKNIRVEWVNAEGTSGVSDIRSENISSADEFVFTDILKDKIVLGWILDDNITAAAGTVEFAIRFYDPDDNDSLESTEVEYSFSTQPARITINNTLNFDLYEPTLITSGITAEFIKNRISASQADEGDIADIPEPIIYLNIVPTGTNELDNLSFTDDDGIDESTDSYTLRVTASAVNQLSYKLKRTSKTGNVVADDLTEERDFEEVYLETEDSSPVEGKIYYELNEDGDGYDVASSVDFSSGTYYEKYAQYKVEEPGSYAFAISNRVGAYPKTIYSNIAQFPEAETPVISGATGSYNEDDGTYSINLDSDELTMTIDYTTPEKNTTTYQWYHGGDSSEDPGDQIDEATGNSWEAEADVEQYYYVNAFNKRNNKPSSTSNWVTFRVTHEPGVIEDNASNGYVKNFTRTSQNITTATLTFVVDFTEHKEGDETIPAFNRYDQINIYLKRKVNLDADFAPNTDPKLETPVFTLNKSDSPSQTVTVQNSVFSNFKSDDMGTDYYLEVEVIYNNMIKTSVLTSLNVSLYNR